MELSLFTLTPLPVTTPKDNSKAKCIGDGVRKIVVSTPGLYRVKFVSQSERDAALRSPYFWEGRQIVWVSKQWPHAPLPGQPPSLPPNFIGPLPLAAEPLIGPLPLNQPHRSITSHTIPSYSPPKASTGTSNRGCTTKPNSNSSSRLPKNRLTERSFEEADGHAGNVRPPPPRDEAHYSDTRSEKKPRVAPTAEVLVRIPPPMLTQQLPPPPMLDQQNQQLQQQMLEGQQRTWQGPRAQIKQDPPEEPSNTTSTTAPTDSTTLTGLVHSRSRSSNSSSNKSPSIHRTRRHRGRRRSKKHRNKRDRRGSREEWPPTMWDISESNDALHLEEQIGEGAYGEVYKATFARNSFAVKVVKLHHHHHRHEHNHHRNRCYISDLKYEAWVHRSAVHENIIPLIGIRETTNEVFFLMPVMECSLETAIFHPEKVSSALHPFVDGGIEIESMFDIALQASRALAVLHEMRILHRDIKTSNFLLDVHFHIRLCDFGFASFLPPEGGDSMESGDALFMAPELFGDNPEPSSKAADIYALSMTFFELFMQCEAFPMYQSAESVENAVHGRAERPVFPANIPARQPVPLRLKEKLERLIQKMWHQEAKERPGIEEVIDRLESMKLAIHIPDHGARSFWKEKFGVNKVQVDWASFMYSMSELISDIRPVQRLVTENGTDTVTAKRFGQLARWFGPFFDENILEEVCPIDLPHLVDLCEKEWFVPSAKDEDCPVLLHKLDYGSFIVRIHPKSDKEVFELCLLRNSKVTYESIKTKHTVSAGVLKTSYKHRLTGAEAHSIPELIQTLCAGGYLLHLPAEPEADDSHQFYKYPASSSRSSS